MMPPVHQLVGRALRILIAVACGCGIWSSLTLARADFLFRQDNESSVRSAIRLVPDGWQYYLRLAQFDRAHARSLLTTSLALNRYDAQADIELGLQYEADGDFDRAEKQLLLAYDVDHTYLPRWSLANYYFRRDNLPAFWTWARSAASMPAEDVGSLFNLCWRVAPDPVQITAAILNDTPELVRQYISFLLAKDQPAAVAGVAPSLVRVGDPASDRPAMFAVVNWLIAANDAADADALWRLLNQKHWVVADTSEPNNGAFQREPLPINFDWSFPEYQGLHSWPGPSGLMTEFTGSQPEDCTIADQTVVLAPGNYSLAYVYRTTDIPPGTGIRWRVIDAKSGAVVAESPDLSSSEVKHSTLAFTVSSGVSLLRLHLAYRRSLGTTRIAGMLNVASAHVEVLSR